MLITMRHRPASNVRSSSADTTFVARQDVGRVASGTAWWLAIFAGVGAVAGSAACPGSPFAGQGANLAPLDAAELGVALAGHSDVESALTAYEPAMFSRAEAAGRASADNLAASFAPDAPQQLVDRARTWLRRNAEGKAPPR